MFYCNTAYNDTLIISAHLQENSNHSESIGLASSLAETCIFGVPMHQMKLEIKLYLHKKKSLQETLFLNCR